MAIHARSHPYPVVLDNDDGKGQGGHRGSSSYIYLRSGRWAERSFHTEFTAGTQVETRLVTENSSFTFTSSDFFL